MGILLHIGAPKTGTTAVQAAVADLQLRTDGGLTGYGLSLPGTPAEQAKAALSVLGQGIGWASQENVAAPSHWPKLLREVRQAQGLAFISSEYFCQAPADTVHRIVQDLGPGDLRVVLTLRPLSRILPSAWQQYLKSGHQLRYENWLEAILAPAPESSVTPSFWRRHDQAAVVERWAAELGPDRMTVVVLDPDDRNQLMRSFDELLGLPPDTLVPAGAGRENRSMSAPEAELFRRLNSVLRRHHLPWDEYARLIRYGAILRTVERYRPEAGAARMRTPDWALERSAALGAGYRDRIAALQSEGLHVIGKLDRLADPSDGSGPDPTQRLDPAQQAQLAQLPDQTDSVPVEVAVQAILGAVSRATNGAAFFDGELSGGVNAGHELGLPGSDRVPIGALPVDRLTARQLSEVLAGRIRDGLTRRYRKHLTGKQLLEPARPGRDLPR
jgi:hypothetical protein